MTKPPPCRTCWPGYGNCAGTSRSAQADQGHRQHLQRRSHRTLSRPRLIACTHLLTGRGVTPAPSGPGLRRGQHPAHGGPGTRPNRHLAKRTAPTQPTQALTHALTIRPAAGRAGVGICGTQRGARHSFAPPSEDRLLGPESSFNWGQAGSHADTTRGRARAPAPAPAPAPASCGGWPGAALRSLRRCCGPAPCFELSGSL